MGDWALKRFWKTVDVATDDTGAWVLLDERRVMTPAKTPLIVPTRGLAERIASEWDAQQDAVDPTTMPFTRMANAALDKVTPQRSAVADMLAGYGETDLLCYRAEAPEGLVVRQAEAWDPLLEWAAERFRARLRPVTGVMPVAQDSLSLERLAQPVHTLDPFTLTGFYDLVSLSGSLVIALATLDEHLDAESLWERSRVDERWQEEVWGEDEEASEHAAIKRQSFLDAAEFCRLS